MYANCICIYRLLLLYIYIYIVICTYVCLHSIYAAGKPVGTSLSPGAHRVGPAADRFTMGHIGNLWGT